MNDIYRSLGCTPVINAAGNQTVIGGSRISPAVQQAMNDANRHFVEMKELQLRTGEIIADLVGSEAAFVTPGCGAALALSAAACMSVGDPARMEQLPDTTGIPNEFLFQARHHYHYERCLTIFGGRVVMVGSESGGTSEAQLEDSITERTAGIHFYAHGDDDPKSLELEDVVRIADRNNLPVIVDAAYQVFPLDRFKYYTQSGASLVGFGAKYVGACNSTGILAGKKELVDAAFAHSFIGFETGGLETVGRPLKLDRQEIVAVVVALREWLELDHDERVAEHWRRTDRIAEGLADLPAATVSRHVESNSLSNGAMLVLDEKALGRSREDVIDALRAGDPSIWVRAVGKGIRIAVAHLVEDELDTIITRLREELSPS